jgi:hypothetical protein
MKEFHRFPAFAASTQLDRTPVISQSPTAVAGPFRKSYPDVLVMQSTEDGNGDNTANPLHASP